LGLDLNLYIQIAIDVVRPTKKSPFSLAFEKGLRPEREEGEKSREGGAVDAKTMAEK
jgi:hypothetical protein